MTSSTILARWKRKISMAVGCKHGHLPPCTQCCDEKIVSDLRAENERLHTELVMKSNCLMSQLALHNSIVNHTHIQNWHERAAIIHDYYAPFCRIEDECKKVVVYDPMYDVFLRGDDSPFWDAYGDDYGDDRRANRALARAPGPQPVRTITIFKLREPNEKGASNR